MNRYQCKIIFGREEKDAPTCKKVTDEGFTGVAGVDNCYDGFIVAVGSHHGTLPLIAPKG
jgi:hypothetical protein